MYPRAYAGRFGIYRLILSTALAGILSGCSNYTLDNPVFSKLGSGDASYGGAEVSMPEPVPPLLPSIGPASSSGAEENVLQPEDDVELPISDAYYRLQGVEIYSRLCASCHLPAEISNRRGVDAGKILNDYTRNFPTHKNIEWPDTEAAFQIEAALAVPPI